MTLLLCVILVALAFEYINGFHDTANSIATVVSTRMLTPRMAIVLAAASNLLGAFYGTAVAKTISTGLVEARFVSTETIVCALLGGILWNLLTWWLGLPSSSSHALVGGLCGATLASADGDWSALIWSKVTPGQPWFKQAGLLYKVVIPMVLSPTIGFTFGFLLMNFLYLAFCRMRPATLTTIIRPARYLSASYVGFSHGQNDAQKTMGIIALTLAAAVKAGTLDHVPAWMEFLRHPMAKGFDGKETVAAWIKVACALTMAAGTAAGGWKIIRTMGHSMVKLLPIHGFAAEMTGATVLSTAAHFGMPVSTTHAITTSIMGVGCAKRWSALSFSTVERILWAWVLTLPVSGALAFVMMAVVRRLHQF